MHFLKSCQNYRNIFIYAIIFTFFIILGCICGIKIQRSASFV